MRKDGSGDRSESSFLRAHRRHRSILAAGQEPRHSGHRVTRGQAFEHDRRTAAAPIGRAGISDLDSQERHELLGGAILTGRTLGSRTASVRISPAFSDHAAAHWRRKWPRAPRRNGDKIVGLRTAVYWLFRYAFLHGIEFFKRIARHRCKPKAYGSDRTLQPTDVRRPRRRSSAINACPLRADRQARIANARFT